jgi:hypothetical protein
MPQICPQLAVFQSAYPLLHRHFRLQVNIINRTGIRDKSKFYLHASSADGTLPDRVVVAIRYMGRYRVVPFMGITRDTTAFAILEWLLTYFTITAKSGDLELFVIPQAVMPLIPTPEELDAPTAIPWPDTFTLRELGYMQPTRMLPTMANTLNPREQILLLKAAPAGK